MTTTVRVLLGEMAQTARVWRGQSVELAGVEKCLDGADTDLLGTRVGPVADRFLAAWAGRVKTMSKDAEVNADDLAEFATGFWHLDGDAARRVVGLLPAGTDTDVEGLW